MNTENKSNTPTEIRDLWQTPKFVFDYYDKRFSFNLDMAASEKNHLCNYYLTESDDALLYESMDSVIDTMAIDDGLDPVVWCNPPYSNLKPWVKSMVAFSKVFKMKIVTIVPADTSVQWFKLAFESCTECHFISGRLAFINAVTQKPVSGNNKGSVVFIFDPESPVRRSVHLIDRKSMEYNHE